MIGLTELLVITGAAAFLFGTVNREHGPAFDNGCRCILQYAVFKSRAKGATEHSTQRGSVCRAGGGICPGREKADISVC